MLPHLMLVALSGAPLVEPPPDATANRTWAFVIGAAIDVAAFSVGAALIGADQAGFDQARAGWVTCSAGFTLGPFVAHAITGQWLRGAAFSAVPLTATIGNVVVLGSTSTQTIDVTPLKEDQRLIVVFTSVGLLGSVIGLIDVLLFTQAKTANIRVTPTVSQTGGGFVIGGSF